MDPTWERARGPGEREAWAEVLVPVARELEAGAAELAGAAVEHVRAELPELLADAETVEENRASTEASLRAFAALLLVGADPGTTGLPVATAAYARASVRRGDALASLMRSYRLATAAVWRVILDRVAAFSRDQEQLRVASQLGAAFLFAYVDGAMSAAEQLYDEERARWLRSTAASQAETIEALLDGRQRDVGQASARLRYELDRHHLAAVAWLDSAEAGDPVTHLENAVGQVARAAGADAVLIHPLGLLAVAAWLGRIERFDAGRLDDVRLDLASAPGVHMAVGGPAAAVAGFRASHAQAVHARRVAALAGRRPGTVTHFGRVALVAMATADVDLARSFVAQELGPLAADDDVARRLAATLRTYLEENASRSRAAKRLNIHENTITYRVRQAEGLLGRSVEERTLELRVALALLPVVPAA